MALIDRLKEPSTWAGVSAACVAGASQFPDVASWLTAGAGVSAVAAVVLGESGAPPEKILADAMRAMADATKR